MAKVYYQSGGITLYHGDFLEVLPTLTVGSIDCVITDPPYRVKDKVELRGTGVARRRSKSTTIGEQGWTLTKEWLSLAAVACRKHMIVFCGYLDMQELFGQWGQGDLRGVFTWEKPNAPMPAWNVPHYDTEFALWFGRGNNPEGMQQIKSMVIKEPFPSAGCVSNGERICTRSGKASHPSQKPLAVMAKFVRWFSSHEQTVLDPFAGTGTTLVAARDAGRKAIGIEVSERYAEMAANRLSQGVLAFD